MYLMENINAYLIIEGLGEESEKKMERNKKRKKETTNKETKKDKENTL